MLNISVPNFRTAAYLEANPDVKQGIESGVVSDAYSHYIYRGIDEHRTPRLNSETLPLRGSVERCLLSESGFVMVIGWLSDEGALQGLAWRLFGAEFNVEIPSASIIRHARGDVEGAVRDGPFDYGFIAFGYTPSRNILKQSLLLQIQSPLANFQSAVTPELASDKRLLDTMLTHLSSVQSHAGIEVGLHHFLSGDPGESLVNLFRRHVDRHLAHPYVERFGARKVERSFMTVLFGSTEPMLMQPMLFKKMGVEFGEWVYVCNSPQDSKEVLRIARAMSELYDVMITVVVMTDNVGFGAANNVGISLASSDNIYIINPDVYPLKSGLPHLRRALAERDLGDNLWGGLLFYDDENLMHSGMFIEHDTFLRSHTFQPEASGQTQSHVKLARVEHFDKSVPFLQENWERPMIVPAISGAVMAFRKPLFEKINGFSTRYIYGHYEDADLSLRWAAANGPVVIDPDFRIVHLEGQGSHSHGPQYRGAQIINRYLFSLQHNEAFSQDGGLMTNRRPLDPGPPTGQE